MDFGDGTNKGRVYWVGQFVTHYIVGRGTLKNQPSKSNNVRYDELGQQLQAHDQAYDDLK